MDRLTRFLKQLTDETEHLALVKGSWDVDEAVPVRVHASSMIGDVFQVSDLGGGHSLSLQWLRLKEKVRLYLSISFTRAGSTEELKAYAEYHEKKKDTGVFHPLILRMEWSPNSKRPRHPQDQHLN